MKHCDSEFARVSDLNLLAFSIPHEWTSHQRPVLCSQMTNLRFFVGLSCNSILRIRCRSGFQVFGGLDHQVLNEVRDIRPFLWVLCPRHQDALGEHRQPGRFANHELGDI